MSRKPDNDNTRERLLDQAEILFSARGFHAVSVREITTAAGSNLAAINYHFGNKTNLYLAVFKERWVRRAKRIRQRFEAAIANGPAASMEDVCRALARAFLKGPWDDDERMRHAQLIQRELVNPTKALDILGQEVMLPFFKSIGDHLRPHMPADIGEDELRLGILSLFSLVIYFNFARTIVSRVTGSPYHEEFMDRLVEHIAAFAARGIGRGTEEKPR